MAVEYVASPGSGRARATAAVTTALVRPITSRLPSNAVGVAVSRALVAQALARFGAVPRGTTIGPVDVLARDGQRIRGEWVRARGVTRWDAAIFYLHGSGYALCSPKTHRGLVARLSELADLPVFSVDYRLAPRYRFPMAADDAGRAFDWLVTNHHAPDRVVVAGDSAGGHLAIDLCLSRLREERSLPAALALFSPIADLTLALAAERERIRHDPMISASAARRLLGMYTNQSDPGHPRLAHLPVAGEVLPPTLIQAGGTEMLAADAHHLHDQLQATGTPTQLEIWPDQMHVFQALPRLIPESQLALARAARFLRAAVPVEYPSASRRTA